MELQQQYDELKKNYSGLSYKHRTVLAELKASYVLEDENKALRRVITLKNRKIKSLEDSRKHLKERYGVK